MYPYQTYFLAWSTINSLRFLNISCLLSGLVSQTLGGSCSVCWCSSFCTSILYLCTKLGWLDDFLLVLAETLLLILGDPCCEATCGGYISIIKYRNIHTHIYIYINFIVRFTKGSPPSRRALSTVVSTDPVLWRSAWIAAVGISGNMARTISIYFRNHHEVFWFSIDCR